MGHRFFALSPGTYVFEIVVGADSQQNPGQVGVGYLISLLIFFKFLRKLCFEIFKVNQLDIHSLTSSRSDAAHLAFQGRIRYTARI